MKSWIRGDTTDRNMSLIGYRRPKRLHGLYVFRLTCERKGDELNQFLSNSDQPQPLGSPSGENLWTQNSNYCLNVLGFIDKTGSWVCCGSLISNFGFNVQRTTSQKPFEYNNHKISSGLGWTAVFESTGMFVRVSVSHECVDSFMKCRTTCVIKDSGSCQRSAAYQLIDYQLLSVAYDQK